MGWTRNLWTLSLKAGWTVHITQAINSFGQPHFQVSQCPNLQRSHASSKSDDDSLGITSYRFWSMV